MGRQAAEFQFKDFDGVDVICSLNVDFDNVPIELDIWKVDFTRLLRFPDVKVK